MRPNGSQDQCVDIPFTGGMAEGVAPFVFNGPFVESAEDCVITKEGAYRGFPGGSAPGVTGISGTSGSSKGLAVFDSALLQHSNQGPFQYNETDAVWRGSNTLGFVPTEAITDPLIRRSGKSTYNVQVAVSSGGYELYLWDEQAADLASRDGLEWTGKGLAVRDPLGGWSIAPTVVSGFGDGPGHQVIALGDTFILAYSDATAFKAWRLVETDTSTASLFQIVSSALYPTTSWAAGQASISTNGTGTALAGTGVTGTPTTSDEYTVRVANGGTIGVAGITLEISYSGGRKPVYTGAFALGVANTITLARPTSETPSEEPSSAEPAWGVTLLFGAGTLVTGDTIAFATRPATTFGSLHDCCAATSSLKAYFLTADYNSKNLRVHTLDRFGLVGTPSTGTYDRGGLAIAKVNGVVFVGETSPAGGVRLTKVPESTVETGAALTSLGPNVALASGGRGLRLRMEADNLLNLVVAVEGFTENPASAMDFIPNDPAAFLPSTTYVEIGKIQYNAASTAYTLVARRAYAHGYCLGSGLYNATGRGIQLALTYTGMTSTGDYGGTLVPPGWTTTDTSGPYAGIVWGEVTTTAISDGQGGFVDIFALRSLTRLCWDSAWSTVALVNVPRGGSSDRVSGNVFDTTTHRQNSLSKAVQAYTTEEAFVCLAAPVALPGSDKFTSRGLDRCAVFLDPLPPKALTAHGALFVDGGCLPVWDGVNSYESAPHFAPMVGWVPDSAYDGDTCIAYSSLEGNLFMTPIVDGGSGGIVNDGFTDTYGFHWEWTDARGYLHRSASSSLQIERTFVGAASHYARTWAPLTISPANPGYFVVAPPLTSNAFATGAGLRLVVSFVPGDGSTTRSLIISSYAYDWSLSRGEFRKLSRADDAFTREGTTFLYTDGGVLQAEATPAPTSIAATSERLWVISSDNRRLLYYSKPIEDGIAPEFNAALSITLPSTAGEGVSVVSLDDKPVVLCEKGLYVISGDGPNALGTQGSFVATSVQTDTGCRTRRSVVACDYGVFFQGSRGVYVLDRGLNTALISQGVQDRVTAAIQGSVVIPEEQNAYFSLAGPGILVYQYALKAWTMLNKYAYASVAWDGAFTRVYNAASYLTHKSDATTNVDSEGPNTMIIRSAWVKANSMQGFARFKRVQLLSSQENGPYIYGPLTVKAFFNYEDSASEPASYFETASWTGTDLVPVAVRSQVQMHFNRQKSESLKLVIESTNFTPAVAPGEGGPGSPAEYFDPASLEGITLRIGTNMNPMFTQLPQRVRR